MAYLGAVHRWDIFWADLEPVVGSEQAGERRPVLVLSNDPFNRRFDVVTVLPLTTRGGTGRQAYPFEVEIPEYLLPGDSPSIVMPYQIRTISKLRLLEFMGRLEDPELQYEIENRTLEHLGIDFSFE